VKNPSTAFVCRKNVDIGHCVDPNTARRIGVSLCHRLQVQGRVLTLLGPLLKAIP